MTPTKEPSTNLPAHVGPRKQDLIWDTLLSVCGINPAATMSTGERGRYNRACKGMRERDATPEQIEIVARAYKMIWPNVPLTPSALDVNWLMIIAKAREEQADKDDLAIARWVRQETHHSADASSVHKEARREDLGELGDT